MKEWWQDKSLSGLWLQSKSICKGAWFHQEKDGLSGSASFIYEYGFPQDGHECFSGSKKK